MLRSVSFPCGLLLARQPYTRRSDKKRKIWVKVSVFATRSGRRANGLLLRLKRLDAEDGALPLGPMPNQAHPASDKAEACRSNEVIELLNVKM
jgi:hypothetical protein